MLLAAVGTLLASHWAWTQFDRRIGLSHAAHEQLERKERLLSEMRQALGYGGFIHVFKDYLLDGEADRLARLDALSRRVRADIRAYEALAGSAEEHTALAQLHLMLDAYQDQLPALAAARRTGQDVTVSNRQASANDASALAALNAITGSLARERAGNSAFLKDIRQAGRQLLLALLGVTAVLFLAGALLIRAVSEKARLNKTLAESEEEARRLAHVATQTSLAVIITNPRGETDWINAGFTYLTGFTIEDLRGRPPGALLQGPDSDPDAIAAMGRAVREGQGVQTELINYRKDGAPFWVQIDIQPVRDRAGELEAFIAIQKDITAERQAEQRLRDFKTTLDSTRDCIFIFDPESLRFTYVNQGAMLQVGHDEQTLLNLHPFDLNPAFDEPLFRALIAPLRRGELTELRFESRHRHRDGHSIPVEVFLQHVAPSGGRGQFVAVVRDVTERKEYERHLQRQRGNLELIYALSARAEADLEHRLQAALAEAAKHLGLEIGCISRFEDEALLLQSLFAPAEIAVEPGQRFAFGTPDHAPFPTQDEPLVIDLIGRSSQRAHPCQSIVPLACCLAMALRLPSNNQCWGIVSFGSRRTRTWPFDEADQDFIRLFARWVSATIETHQTHEALRLSEARLQRSQTFANIGTWDWNIQSGELYWSERIAPLFGYGVGEIETSYDNFLAAIHPDDRQQVMDAVSDCVERGLDYNLEHRVIWPNGEVRWLHERGDVVRTSDGAPLKMLGVVRDVTKRRRYQDQLNRFRQLIEAAEQGIGIADLERQLVYVNPAHCRMLGYENPSRLLGCDWLDLVGEQGRADALQLDEQLRVGRSSHTRPRLPLVRADGSEFIALFNLGTISDAAGKPQFAFSIFEDISDELARQQQLLDAKETAERASQAKSAFLSRMSHELRTPLNSIIGFAQLLANSRRASLSDKQTDQVRHIERNGRHLLTLINEILDLARIESGRLSLSLDTVDLDQILDDVLDTVTPAAEARGIAIGREASATGAAVLLIADRLRLKQVLINLLTNAVKYNRDQGEVRVSVGPIAAGQIRVAIRDTGPGIPADRLEAVFEPFNRLEADRSGIEGTGIGLTIVRELVEQMRGRIGVDSQLGEGSVFWIDLPQAQADEAPAPAARSLYTGPAEGL